jgi:hypothetical protein
LTVPLRAFADACALPNRRVANEKGLEGRSEGSLW